MANHQSKPFIGFGISSSIDHQFGIQYLVLQSRTCTTCTTECVWVAWITRNV